MVNLKQSESGRTMLEMLGVLGIMGIIMYGAVAGINYGMSTYKINQVYNEVQEAIQGIQDLYSWQKDYSSGNIQQLVCGNDIFPRSCDGSNNLSSPFVMGAGITVSTIHSDKSFAITYNSIPQTDCQRLLEMEWGTVDIEANCDNDSNNVVFCPKTRSGTCSD